MFPILCVYMIQINISTAINRQQINTYVYLRNSHFNFSKFASEDISNFKLFELSIYQEKQL